MNLKVISSGSIGNCYVLESASETLLIECGIPFSEIKKGIDFDFNKLKGAIVSHSHNDHSKSMPELVRYGVKVYASEATHKEVGTIISHNATIIEPLQKFTVGSFTILPFEVKHDVPTFGFLLYHIECGKVCFATDTYFIPQTFRGLNNIIVEANFCEEIINEKMGWKSEKRFLRDRIIQSHFSLQNCKDFLKANDLSQVHNIVLIHLSDTNSDAKRFQREVSDLTGKTVTVAKGGLTIPFNIHPY